MTFNAGLMNSAFEKINDMMEVFKEFRPLLRERLGSARRSPTAGPSDIDRPNPLDKVSDVAPQGPVMAPQSPDMAPGPSSASYDPHALSSSRHDAHRDEMFVSPRGGVDKGEHVPYGIRHVSPSTSPSHQERLRDELERVHTEISQIREINDFCRARGRAPPDHSYRDLEILQAKYAQLSLALEESLQASSSRRRGRSPSFTSHRVVSPSDAHHPLRPDSSSLHRPRLSPRPRSPSQDRSRSRDDYSGHHRHSRRSQERYLKRFVSSATPSHGRRPVHGGPLLLSGWNSQGSPLLNSGCDSHQEGHPLQSEWALLLTPGPVPARDPFQGILLLQGHAPQGIPSLQRASPLHLSEWDSLREVLLLPNDNVLSRGTQILLDGSIHPELRLVRLLLRDPIRGLLLPILILLREKIRKLKTPLCQPQLRP